MADGVFNISKGRVNQRLSDVHNDGTSTKVILLVLVKTMVDSDVDLAKRDTLAACLVSGTGLNTEANFTNYSRVAHDFADIVEPVTDDTNAWQQGFFPDTLWADAGGALNNTLAKLLVCYDANGGGGTDADIVPLTHHDFVITTNGGDLTADVGDDGFYRAA